MDEENVGQWGSGEPGSPSLELHVDGRATGTDGCNRLMGSWRIQNESIVFSQMVSTMMFCQDVDTWLSQLASATEADGQLIIHDAAGKEIGRLDRREI